MRKVGASQEVGDAIGRSCLQIRIWRLLVSLGVVVGLWIAGCTGCGGTDVANGLPAEADPLTAHPSARALIPQSGGPPSPPSGCGAWYRVLFDQECVQTRACPNKYSIVETQCSARDCCLGPGLCYTELKDCATGGGCAACVPRN